MLHWNFQYTLYSRNFVYFHVQRVSYAFRHLETFDEYVTIFQSIVTTIKYWLLVKFTCKKFHLLQSTGKLPLLSVNVVARRIFHLVHIETKFHSLCHVLFRTNPREWPILEQFSHDLSPLNRRHTTRPIIVSVLIVSFLLARSRQGLFDHALDDL